MLTTPHPPSIRGLSRGSRFDRGPKIVQGRDKTDPAAEGESFSQILVSAHSFFSIIVSIRDPSQANFALKRLMRLVNVINTSLANESSALGASVFKKPGDYNTFVDHSLRVSVISLIIAQWEGLKSRDCVQVGSAGLLHDIGKLSAPVINKRRKVRVSAAQLRLEQTHPLYGYKTAQEILDLSQEICDMVLNHHECPNKKGFPRQVGAEDLSKMDHVLILSNALVESLGATDYGGVEVAISRMMTMEGENQGTFDSTLLAKLPQIFKRFF